MSKTVKKSKTIIKFRADSAHVHLQTSLPTPRCISASPALMSNSTHSIPRETREMDPHSARSHFARELYFVRKCASSAIVQKARDPSILRALTLHFASYGLAGGSIFVNLKGNLSPPTDTDQECN
ncbi:hypothetical protein ACLB2K_025844 [Fragaria x ananassa]